MAIGSCDSRLKNRGILNSVFFIIMTAIAAFAGHGFYTFQKDLQLMEDATVEDIIWTASQLELELQRFRESVLSFQIADADVDAADVNERFDILWSRIILFQQGSVGKRLNGYVGEDQLIEKIFTSIKEIEDEVVGLSNGDNTSATTILEKVEEYPQSLRELSRAITLGEEERNRDIRRALSFGVNRTMVLATIATLMAIIAMIYIYRQSVRAIEMSEVNRKLARVAETANRAKSRFLTMMSHELRTPMNGVLGLLAVVSQQATDDNQKMLIGTAENSAKKMVGLLGNVFDFSVLQSETISVTCKPFEVARFESAFQDEVYVRRSENCPKLLVGDFKRLTQAFNHLSEYILDTAGTRNVAIDLDYRANEFVMRLAFEYLEDGGAWKPDLILGLDERGGDNFTTDALGPTIARGLLHMMGGTVSLCDQDDNKIAVICKVPLPAFDVDILNVKILSNSAALPSICRASIKDERIKFLDNSDNSDTHVYLIETGDSAEVEYLRNVSQTNPGAILVSLGQSVNPEVFDFKVKIPLDFKKMCSILTRHIS